LIFKHNDISEPKNAYSISKYEAEQILLEISKQTGLEVVIIRPPLVYGEGVKGKFLRLLDIVYKQIPLPFAKTNNLRSFVSLDNLIDLIICCIEHPKAAGKTFLVSDGEDLSTTDLIRKLSKFMNKSPRLFSVPHSIIQLIGCLVGKSLEVKRLLGSLRIDNSYAREILGWSPVLSLDEGLKKTVRWYLKNR
jgi:nucleoside-diphosphate-sugar epimerase